MCARAQNLTRGCKVYFPVFVEGAMLSMGDMHFSQGDGEVSFCGAIEMSGFLHLKCAPGPSSSPLFTLSA
jgi:formamidase